MTLIERALIFAFRFHAGQKRKYSGDPYVVHPITVADIVGEHTGRDDLVAAALLHDVIEDCDVVADELVVLFGREIAGIVVELTDVYTKEDYPDKNRKARKRLEASRLALASQEAQIIKIADMLDNSRHMDPTDEFVDVYADEKTYLLDLIGSAHPGLAEEARSALHELVERRASPDYPY